MYSTLLHFVFYNYESYVLNFNLKFNLPNLLLPFSPYSLLLSSRIVYQLIRKNYNVRDYIQARLKVFYEEELDVPLVLFNKVLNNVLHIDRIFKQQQVGVSSCYC